MDREQPRPRAVALTVEGLDRLWPQVREESQGRRLVRQATKSGTSRRRDTTLTRHWHIGQKECLCMGAAVNARRMTFRIVGCSRRDPRCPSQPTALMQWQTLALRLTTFERRIADNRGCRGVHRRLPFRRAGRPASQDQLRRLDTSGDPLFQRQSFGAGCAPPLRTGRDANRSDVSAGPVRGAADAFRRTRRPPRRYRSPHRPCRLRPRPVLRVCPAPSLDKTPAWAADQAPGTC